MDDDVGFGDQRVEGFPIQDVARLVRRLVRPCDAGSNGRRAIPTIRPTAGPRQRGHRRDPDLASGPVSATVSPMHMVSKPDGINRGHIEPNR